VVRAVFRTGSFAAAARCLSINETTVARRLTRLQNDLGVTLFEAVDGARVPTRHCEEIVALTETIADRADRIANIGRVEHRHFKRRRIAATDSITAEVLAPNAAPFLLDHPELTLDFLASTENVDFSRWEADIAIRLKRPEKGNFVMSKLTELDLYYVEPALEDSRSDTLVCAYPDELNLTPESKYFMQLGLHQKARCRSKNLLVLKRMVLSKRCCAVLPGYMCSDLFTAEGFHLTKFAERRSAWLLRQSHLKSDPATRTVIDRIKRCFDATSMDT